jgi:hypothetical protein
MKRTIISGMISMPEQERQRRLHQELGAFADWMHRPKDANEIQKDRLQAVPIAMLPTVF